MPYASRRQWKWAFASGQPFARRWAHETPGGEGARFRRLPERAAKAEPAENAQSGAPRKKMTPAEVARHAALVRWKKKNPLMARQMAIREKRKAKGSGAKPKPAPVDKAAQQAENRAKTYEALGLFEDATAALDALRKGEAVDDDGGLVKLGLAEQAADGTYRLTAAGRALHSAASRGDVGAARDTLSKAKDRAEASAAAEAEAAGKEGKEGEKPKGGGGGGGGGGKEEPEDKDAAKEQERAQRTAETAGKVGLAPEDTDDLRAAAEAGGVQNEKLIALGLVGEDGTTTDQGRRALTALERGDVRGYRAALQDVEAARGRAKAKADRDAERGAEREARDAEREQARAEREQARADKDAAREKAKADKEAQELDDMADDYRRGRRGLSFEQQRKLIRAGRARMNGEKFELKTTDDDAPAWRWAIKQTASERAMFANMGSSGGGGGGGKPSGGQGGLWKRGPDGKRTPQAGVQTPKPGGGGGDKPAAAAGSSGTPVKPSKPEKDDDASAALPRKRDESDFAYEMRLLDAEESGQITMAQRDSALRQLLKGSTTADPAAVARLKTDIASAQSRMRDASAERERAQRDLVSAQVAAGNRAAAAARRRTSADNPHGLSGDGRSENNSAAARVRAARARLERAQAAEDQARRAAGEVYRNYGDLEIAAARETKARALALQLDLLELDHAG
jgi:hypothetical protein